MPADEFTQIKIWVRFFDVVCLANKQTEPLWHQVDKRFTICKDMLFLDVAEDVSEKVVGAFWYAKERANCLDDNRLGWVGKHFLDTGLIRAHAIYYTRASCGLQTPPREVS